MELYNDNLDSLKYCYQKYKFEDIMNLEIEELRLLCIRQRGTYFRQLFSKNFNMKTIINDRLKITKDEYPDFDITKEPAEKYFIRKN